MQSDDALKLMTEKITETKPDTNRKFIIRNRAEGHVIECDGMRAVISSTMKRDGSASEDYWSVGMLLSINVGDLRTIGILYKIDSDGALWDTNEENRINIHVELIGEIKNDNNGKPAFNGGISVYPHLGAIAHRIRAEDLAAVFENNDNSAIKIGSLTQSADIPALIAVNRMISRHFAVVGTTGAGKSSTVTLLLRKIIEVRPDIRILILDPHNEFSSAFPDKAFAINDSNLSLPFWAFKLEEFTEVLFRGQPHIPQEVEILRDTITRAKIMFKGQDRTNLRKTQADESGITSDTPVPYRISDLTRLIDDEMGKLGNGEQRTHLKALLARINAITADPNFRFMFSNTTVEDNLDTILSTIFRVPAHGRPITVFQLSGIPSEVINAVVSVLCRLSFDLAVWSKSKIKTLVVCEEAHRYIPADKSAGFWPTRQSIARIAKEGRKYGVSLGIITQRPGELDDTILSQCNTLIAMRLGNELDQKIMHKAIAGASRSYINFLPSLANREAIMFGEGVSTPMRMRIDNIPQHELPANHLQETPNHRPTNVEQSVNLKTILHEIRYPGIKQVAIDSQAPLGSNVVAEQPKTITPHSHQRENSLPSGNSVLFTQTSSLRKTTHEQNSQFSSENIRKQMSDTSFRGETEQQNQSGNSLINRFRKS